MVLGEKNSDAEQMNGGHELLGSLWLSRSYSSRGARVNAGAQGLERNFQRWKLFCALLLEISKSTDTQIKIEYWSSTQDFEMKSIFYFNEKAFSTLLLLVDTKAQSFN